MLSPSWTLGVEVVIPSTCEFSVHFICIHLKTHNTSTLHHFYIHALPLLLDYETCEDSSDISPGQPDMSWSIDLWLPQNTSLVSFTLQVCNRGIVNEWLLLGYENRPDSGKVTYICVSTLYLISRWHFSPIRAGSRTLSQRTEES